MISTDGKQPEELPDLQKKADEALAAAKAGQDFAGLARKQQQPTLFVRKRCNPGCGCEILGRLRIYCAEILKSQGRLKIPANRFDFLWVVDFPLLSFDREQNRWYSSHHPFTAPHPDDLPLLDSAPQKARAQAYDCILNGTELGGGSIRINDPALQARVFGLLGIDAGSLPYVGRNLLGAPDDAPVVRPYGDWLDSHHLFASRGAERVCYSLTRRSIADLDECRNGDLAARRTRDVSRRVVVEDLQERLRQSLGGRAAAAR